MTVEKSRHPVLVFATMALGIALASSPALAAHPMHAAAKSLVRPYAQGYGMNSMSAPRAVRPQPQNHVDDPWADLWLG
ncbi:hypothetical protein Q2941_30240 [Bradyrhizobium sp. UFLA05-153]